MKKLNDKVSIEKLRFKNRLVLAPMAGVSDAAFRKLCHDFGASLVVSEMISDHAFHYRNEKTNDMIKTFKKNGLLSIQIFGSNKEYIIELAKYIDTLKYVDIIDFNMGCPVPKVCEKAKAGAFWLKDIDKIYDLVRTLVSSVKKPVSVKIRSGYDEKNINAVEVAKTLEKAGVSFITIHPRTKTKGYSGHSDWDIIKQIKKEVNIPIIGNGDVYDYNTAKLMLEKTNCDLVMIGRATQGHPYIFKEILDAEKNKYYNYSFKKIIKIMKKHYKYLIKNHTLKIANLKMKSHVLWYLKKYRIKDNFLNEYLKTGDFNKLYSIISKFNCFNNSNYKKN